MTLRDAPPALWRRVATSLVPPERREELEGDLIERWSSRGQSTYVGAVCGFWLDVASVALQQRPLSLCNRESTEASRSFRHGVHQMLQDFRFAGRLARRRPAFSILVVATLALGIAATTTIFTICHRVLLQPLPYPAPERLVALEQPPFAFTARGMAVPRGLAALPVFSAVGMYAAGGLNLGDARAPARVRAAAVSSGLFDALGVRPAAGRYLDKSDDRDARRVAVLSYTLWRGTYAQDAGIVGRAIRLNSQSFEVVGVMPAGFTFPADCDVWIPVESDPQITGAAFAPAMLARLAPGVSIPQATTALRQFDESRTPPGVSRENLPSVVSLHTLLVKGPRPTLVFLAVVVGVLLAVACANVASLLLSTLRVRERELAVRTALGAGRLRLVRQLAAECGLLAMAGALIGFPIAALALRVTAASVPDLVAEVDLRPLDGTLVVICSGVSVISCVLFCLAPAVAAGRRHPAAVMREGAMRTHGVRQFSHALAASQVAGTLVVLAATTVALTTVARLARIDLGFNNPRAIVFQVTLPLARYADAGAVASLVEHLASRLESIGAARAVGATDYAPGSKQIGVARTLWRADDGHLEKTRPTRPSASWLMASPDYFRAMGIATRAGRTFTGEDRSGSPPVVVINESLARNLAGDPAAAVGLDVQLRGRGASDLTVVGVVGDVQLRGVAMPPSLQAYVPVTQGWSAGNVGIAIDPAADPNSTLEEARRALQEIDPELPPYDVIRISDLRARYLATERLVLELTGVFGGMTLALSAIGIFGVLAQIVVQRTREIGIRMALGADRARLRAAVIATALKVAGIGIVVGLAVVVIASDLLTGVTASIDKPSVLNLGLAGLLLLGVAVAAAWIPARRASDVDPVRALRAD